MIKEPEPQIIVQITHKNENRKTQMVGDLE